MSNKFLSSGGDINLSNGSQTIFGATIGAVNLNPSTPIKTNSVREIVSEKLDIGDVNNLTDDLKIKQNLSFVKNDSQTNPPSNQIKIYAKADGELYKRDSAGNESGLGGGGGVSTTNPPVEDQGLVFYDGTTGDTIKAIPGMRSYYDAIADHNVLIVGDLETENHLSVDTILTNINYTPATDITRIDGELDVDKIKNTAHTAEIEFENTGALTLTCDNDITISSTNSSIAVESGVDININTDGNINCNNPTNINTIRFNTNPDSEISFYESINKKGAIKMGSTGVGTDMEITADTLSVKRLGGAGDFFRVWNQGTYTNFELKDGAGTTIGRFDTIGTGGENSFNINSYDVNGISDGKINMNANSTIFKNLQNTNTTTIDAANQRIEMKEGATSKFYIQETLLGTSLNSQNGMFLTNNTGDIIITANGQFKTNQTPTDDLSVVNKQYLDANTQPKPAVYMLSKESGDDYNPQTNPIHTIETTVAGAPVFLNIGWNNSGSSGGNIQAYMGPKYPSMYATTSIADGSQYISNNYKYMPSNPTSGISYNLNTTYIVNGALATCFISPLEKPPPSPPITTITPTYPVIKITVHTVEISTSPYSYMMMIEQF